MKKLIYLFSILALFSLVVLSACDKRDDDDKKTVTDQQKAAKSLSERSPWQVTTVVTKPNANIDETPLKSLKLSFAISGSESSIAPAGFTASGADNFLSAESNATWNFSETGTSTISLTGASTSELTNVQFDPSIEAPTAVTVTFVVPSAGGRTKGLSGTYTVILE